MALWGRVPVSLTDSICDDNDGQMFSHTKKQLLGTWSQISGDTMKLNSSALRSKEVCGGGGFLI